MLRFAAHVAGWTLVLSCLPWWRTLPVPWDVLGPFAGSVVVAVATELARRRGRAP